MLDEEDRDWLTAQGFEFETVDEDGLTNLILRNCMLPTGFDREQADVLVRLPKGFPDTGPDMFWVDPPIRRSKDGAYPPQADYFEVHAGRQWQRFSRHFTTTPWRPGIDSLESWILCVQSVLRQDGAA